MSENTSFLFSTHKTISIKQLLIETILRWKIVVGTVLAFLFVVIIYLTFFVTPLYSSTAKILIINKQSTTTSASDLELSESTYLARDFAEIIVDKRILSTVSDRLDNKYSVGQLKGFISINNPTSTRIIEITAASPDPEDSKIIVDTICDVAQEEMVELMGIDRINHISDGDVSKKASSPNSGRIIFLTLILGLIAGFAIVALIYATDNKVSSTEDVEKYFEISVLATIPYNNKGRNPKKIYSKD